MHRRIITSIMCLLVFVSCQQQDPVYVQSIEKYRTDYKATFAATERAPIRTEEELAKMQYFAPDQGFKVPCKVEILPQPKSFGMNTYSGAVQPYSRYADLSCKVQGDEISLSVYTSDRHQAMRGINQKLFLPFKDATNGDETYGGGRYIDVSKSMITEGVIEIDFNKAYNPWCAYADGYSCPIPPVENHLAVPIRAGEKMYPKSK